MKNVNEMIELGERMSQELEDIFTKHINHSYEKIPKDLKPEDRVDALELQFDIFMDYLFGTTVALACKFGSQDEGFEKKILTMVSDKFSRMRLIRPYMEGQ